MSLTRSSEKAPGNAPQSPQCLPSKPNDDLDGVHAPVTMSEAEKSFDDGENSDHEPPMTFKRFMVFVAMSFLWTGSQIPLYLYGGIIPIIMGDIGGSDRYVWLLLGNLIPSATITPFVGALSDLSGRRNLSLGASVILIIGNVVCATAHTMNVFIGGQVLCGIGAGVLELTALAITAEQAPTSKRGIYVGAIVITIIPYCLSVLYAQEVAAHTSWRWIGLWLSLWSFLGMVLVGVFYWPPPRSNSSELSRREVLKQIDYVGGFLSAAGFTLFLAGLTWGGNQYSWKSSHVLSCLIIGVILVILFAIWEMYFVKYPMFPGRLKQNPRAMIVILVITFVSGANFFAVLVFWPSQYFFMYAGDDPVSVGVGSLPVGFCIIGGSVIVAVLLSILKGKVRLLMIISCLVMTIGTGSMAAATLSNLKYMYVAVSFACLGVGAVIVPNQIIASIVCPDDLIATVTALTISVRMIGGAIGYAIFYNIIRQKFTYYATEYIAPVAIMAGVTDYWEIYNIAFDIAANLRSELHNFPHINTVEKYNALIAAGQLAFSLSFPPVYYTSIAFGSVSVIAACFLPDLTPFMNSHIAVAYPQ